MAKQYRFRLKSLDVYQAAVQQVSWTVQVMGRLPRGPFVIPNQVVGASLSILGNVAEANGREKQPGEAEQDYRYAQGSTYESAAYLDALSALDVIDDDEHNFQEAQLDRIAAMLTRLMQTQRRRKEFNASSQQPRGPQARAQGRAAAPTPSRPQAAPPNSREAAPKRSRPQAAASKSDARSAERRPSPLDPTHR
jgi:four helix bundle protein